MKIGILFQCEPRVVFIEAPDELSDDDAIDLAYKHYSVENVACINVYRGNLCADISMKDAEGNDDFNSIFEISVNDCPIKSLLKKKKTCKQII